MNELIKITKSNINGNEINSVNARELHILIESKTKFNDWIKRRIEKFNFIENEDYIILKKENRFNTGDESIEYIISLDMAKELSMVENNNKGREIRKYFIAIEKQFIEEQKIFINQPKMKYRSLPSEIMARKSTAIKEYVETTAILFKLDEKGTLLFAQDMYNRNKFPVPHLPQLEIKSDDDNYLYKTEIYKHFDCVKGNPKLKNIINAILVNTEKEYSKSYEYCNNGHTGGTLKYKKSILKLIEKQLKK